MMSREYKDQLLFLLKAKPRDELPKYARDAMQPVKATQNRWVKWKQETNFSLRGKAKKNTKIDIFFYKLN